LVSVSAARPGDCDFHVGHHHHGRDYRTLVWGDAEIFRWVWWSPRLAMAVPGAGFARDCSWLPRVLPSGRQAFRCQVALPRREGTARRQPAARCKGRRKRDRRLVRTNAERPEGLPAVARLFLS